MSRVLLAYVEHSVMEGGEGRKEEDIWMEGGEGRKGEDIWICLNICIGCYGNFRKFIENLR